MRLEAGITYSKKALAVFSVKERNAILKIALEHAGDTWVVKFLPKRFERPYMRQAPFSHSVGNLSFRQKIRKARFQGQSAPYDFTRLQPLVMSGTTRHVSMAGARTKATAPKGNVRGKIIIPTGHALHRDTRALLTGMTTGEINAIAHAFETSIRKMLNQSKVKRTAKGRVAKRKGIAQRTMHGSTTRRR